MLGVRSKQVLAVVREHGPLSIRVIAQVLDPPMSVRKCQEAIQRLRQRQLIRRFAGYLPEKSGDYYALNGTKQEVREIAAALDMNPETFEACFVRGAEIKHGEQCALWAEYFRKEYPMAKVVRDWEISKHLELKDAFASLERERDLLPDILVCFPKTSTSERVLIAIEIERTLKKRNRLLAKIKSLAMQTELDGVIYVCGGFEIGEALRSAFSKASLSKSRRVGSYAPDFLLFSTFDALAGKIGPRFVNTNLEVRSIGNWIDLLRFIPVRRRSSEMLLGPA